MSVEVTPQNVRALNDKIVVARWFKHTDGTEDVWVKGSLKDILDEFVPEGYVIVPEITLAVSLK